MLVVVYTIYGCLTRVSAPVPTRTEAELLQSLLEMDPGVTEARIEAADYQIPVDRPALVSEIPF